MNKIYAVMEFIVEKKCYLDRVRVYDINLNKICSDDVQ